MKSAVLTLFILLLTAGFSHGADTQDNTQQSKPKNRSYSLKTSSYIAGRYSKTLNDMITRALKMDISDEQKAKVSELRNDYGSSISKEEKESRKANVDIRKMLEDPSFDPAVVKKEMEKAGALDKKISESYVDALAALRDVIGKENYASVSKSVSKYQDSLVQMRKDKKSDTRPHSTVKSAPAKTSTPGTQDSKN